MDAVLLGRRCSRHTAGRERRVAARADGARTAAGACARAVVGWHAGGGAALLTTEVWSGCEGRSVSASRNTEGFNPHEK